MTFRRIRFFIKRSCRTLGRATGSAHAVALGVAIGFFVGWLPIVGIQMVVSMAICHFARANKGVSIFPIWLTNPATIVPIYSFNYWIGWKVVGGPPLSELVAVLIKMLSPPAPTPDMNWFSAWWSDFRHSFGELLAMGWEMQLPLWLGCVIVGTALAVPSYYATFRVVESFRKTLHHKRSRRQAAFLSSGASDAGDGS